MRIEQPPMRVYLDHNATTPLRPEARDAMTAALEVFGNPSSVHAEGRRARNMIDEARREVSKLTGAAVENIVFTSGGTEALNLVLTPDLTVDGARFDHLLMSAGEHPAVMAGHRFGERAEMVPLDRDGTIDLDALDQALTRRRGQRVMLALQAANNETGVIQPVAEAATRIHAHGGYVVCDAVQAVGKISCDLKSLGADALAISAHKFGGPKGVGALCFGASAHHLRTGIIRGGGQERGLRSGTENVIGIAGLGAVCEPAIRQACDKIARMTCWRERIEGCVRAVVPDAVVFGAGVARLPNTVALAVSGFDAQVLMMNLDLNGVAASAGSACASGKVKPSHVLTAMGVAPELATSTIRVSLGWSTTDKDIEAFAAAFAKAVTTMRPRAAA